MNLRSPLQRVQVLVGVLVLGCTLMILLRGRTWEMSDSLRYLTVGVESMTGLAFIWLGLQAKLQ
jgi:hypothetical protein